jgi:hypothetical protein
VKGKNLAVVWHVLVHNEKFKDFPYYLYYEYICRFETLTVVVMNDSVF